MKTRPPIIAVVGHIDHGKTTLLDYIRKTNVTAREAGGITQSIGAYEIEHNGKRITFIDTPGHEAFSRMRKHGIAVADLVVLVVAADDGVKPQTKDALLHIREADIPFVVAINKIDLQGADVEKTKKDLAQASVFLEGQGGTISFQEISALKGDGIDALLDLVLLVAEVEELSYDPDAPGKGIVLTSVRDARRGILAGVVLHDGTVRTGDSISTKSAKGKIKLLEDAHGTSVQELYPSTPALILGFENLPQVGEEFIIGEDLMIEHTEEKKPVLTTTENKDSIKVILKADESGSLEALCDMFEKLGELSPLKVVNQGVGIITENDVKLSITTNAIIVGFRSKIDKAAQNLSMGQHITIITSPIIYKLEEQFREIVQNAAQTEKRIIDVLAIFGKRKRNQQVIGGKVTRGPVKNQESFIVIYNENEQGSGRIINLQSGKEDVSQAEEEQEVGLLVESEKPIQSGCQLVFT